MGQALYRQYRPKTLHDVIGQEHITSVLTKALADGKLAHAYLFTGPRGTGKTSIARILAHQINNLPYEDESVHLDIIEIDAASNRRIDEIRDIRDKVHAAPTSAKFKVYIIDEVHMLTREAFNALLKTLEEPPAHVVFILATTEAHKLPETIISRTQRFIFRPVEQSKVIDHLKRIADAENLPIDNDALSLIAAYGEGSFRDSISLLDQTRGHNSTIDADFVRTLIGIPTDEAVEGIIHAMQSKDVAAVVQSLANLHQQGFAAPQVAKHISQKIRNDIVAGKVMPDAFDLLAKLLNVPTAHDPEEHLQLSLLEWTLAGSATSQTQMPTTSSHKVAAASVAAPTIALAAKQPDRTTPKQIVSQAEQDIKPSAQSDIKVPPVETANEQKPLPEPVAVDENLWPEVLNVLKKSHNTLYGIARMARPVFDSEGLELGFGFDFHRKRFSEPKNKEILAQAIKSLTGSEMAVRCVLISKDTPIPSVTMPQTGGTNDQSVSAIANIFGGAEVLSE